MKLNSNEARKRRHLRIRKKIFGTEERPRLNVYRSNRNLYAQIINDDKHHTLLQCSTLSLEEKVLNQKTAAKLGELIAKEAVKKNITNVVFDRGGYLYHGKIVAFTTAARENGLKF